jgi:predicted component of type VI protein secretion system
MRLAWAISANSKDYERLTASSEATMKVSMIHLMRRRLKPDKTKQMPAFTYRRTPRKAA